MATTLAPRDRPQAAGRCVAGLHVQVLGTGPDVLLIHGTAASGDSWCRLAVHLARNCRVLIPDLPGHARSAPATHDMSMDAMTRSLAGLLDALDARPDLIIGHSAGAALGAALALRAPGSPPALVAIAPAMLRFPGFQQILLSGLAGLLAGNPLIPRFVSWRARDPDAVAGLLRGIGCQPDAAVIERYATLLRDSRHIAGVIRMMANWDLAALERRLPALAEHMLIIAGADDRAVPPAEIDRLLRHLPRAVRVNVAGAGHLPHEERPAAVLEALRCWATSRGLVL